MYDSFIARISALGLAAIVSLSILAGIDALATSEHAAIEMAGNARTPHLMVAASGAMAQEF